MSENKTIIALILMQEYTNFRKLKKAPSYREFKYIAVVRDEETKQDVKLLEELNITPEHYWQTGLIVKEILENRKGIKVKLNDPDIATPPFELEKSLIQLEKEWFLDLVVELIEENYNVKVDKNQLEFDKEDAWIKGAYDPETKEILEEDEYFEGVVKMAMELISKKIKHRRNKK